MSTSKRPLPLLVRAKESTPPSERTGGRLINEIARKSSFAGDELIVVHRQQDNMGYSATLDGVKAYIASIKPYGILQVVDGDTLPLLCNKIYKDSSYYIQVAKFNGLNKFRNLKPGTKLKFPPLR